MAETKKKTTSTKKTTTSKPASSKSSSSRSTASKSTSSSKPATTSSSSSSSSSRSSNGGLRMWGINKISFWTIGAVAILYLLAALFAGIGLNSKVIGVLQGIATAIVICIAAFLAWKYVRGKQVVWKVLYIVFLLVVLVGIVIPLCF